MLKFAWFPETLDHSEERLRGLHLVGPDSVPIRGEVKQENGLIVAAARSKDPVGLSVLWPVPGFGLVQLETTRLLPRAEPYHLPIELVRHRLMRLSIKREEWGLFDYEGMDAIAEQIDVARDLFLAALEQIEDGTAAAELANRSLSAACHVSDELCRFHAQIFLQRRRQSNGFEKGLVGVAVPVKAPKTVISPALAKSFDFVRVPFTWRELRPKEQGVQFDEADQIVKAAVAVGLPLRGGPLLSFGVQSLPDWMYIFEHDFETVCDYARDHVRRTVQRYGSRISSWIAVSGLHADNAFTFNFEQIIDLTRAAVTTVKQVQPKAQVVLDLTQPWGEYYARNPQTVPPMLYAEMAVQNAIPFDAFGVQFLLGIDSQGFRMRDLLQVSSLIDRLANSGKAIQITAVAVPAEDAGGGWWLEPWTEKAQSEWITRFAEVVFSKPFVESLCLHALTDPWSSVPHGGAARENLAPRPLVKCLKRLRNELVGQDKP